MVFTIKEESIIRLKNFNSIIAFSNIISILSDADEFNDWLKSQHNLIGIESIFEGYKFTLLITIGCLTNSFISNDPFSLEEDRTYRTATSIGIPLEDIPNTCEKTIFRKKLWNIAATIRGLKDWKALSEKIDKIKKLASFSSFLIDKSTLYNDNLDKAFVLSYITADKLLVLFHDTKRGYPLALTELDTSIYESYKRPFYLEKVIRGYVFTLQYIWFKLFKNDFMNYSIKNLHDILQISKRELKSIQNPILEGFEQLLGSDSSNDDEFLEEIQLYERMRPKALREELRNEYFESKSIQKNPEKYSKILEAQKLWFVLDRFFDLVKEEIIRPTEDKLEVKSSLDSFFYFESIKDASMEEYFPDKVEQPDYLQNDDEASVKQQLDYFLLWHKIAVLDAQAGFTFNGVYAFAATLLGILKLRKENENHAEVVVRVFKHPAWEDTQHYYSFGILIEPYYGLSGTSGWIIYYSCATDFSGSGERLRSFAYKFIEDYKIKGIIEVDEFRIEKEIFEEYLKERSISSVFDKTIIIEPMAKFTSKGIRELKIECDSIISNFKGKLFEFVVHKWLSQNQSYIETYCDIFINNEQIDCLCLTNDNIVEVYECKFSLHDDEMQRTIQQINNRLIAVGKEYPNYKVGPFLVLFKPVPRSKKKKLLDINIRVLDNFERIIKEDNCFHKTEREILHYLNFSGVLDFTTKDFH